MSWEIGVRGFCGNCELEILASHEDDDSVDHVSVYCPYCTNADEVEVPKDGWKTYWDEPRSCWRCNHELRAWNDHKKCPRCETAIELESFHHAN
jgi:hypothetical protein